MAKIKADNKMLEKWLLNLKEKMIKLEKKNSSLEFEISEIKREFN